MHSAPLARTHSRHCGSFLFSSNNELLLFHLLLLEEKAQDPSNKTNQHTSKHLFAREGLDQKSKHLMKKFKWGLSPHHLRFFPPC